MADKFDAKKYERRLAAFASVRSGATALKDAKASADALKEWDPVSLPDSVRTMMQRDVFKGIAECESYMERYSASSLDALCADKISFGYSIFGDVKREAMMGANTQGIDVTVKWDLAEVTVDLYNGVNREMLLGLDGKTITTAGAKDKSAVAKATGWSRNDCNAMTPEQVRVLTTLLTTTKSGSNKYTRLVKGMLIYLDLLHDGSQVVTKRIPNMVEYNMNDVTASFTHRDRSYVFCSAPENLEYLCSLCAMAEAFPNPDIASSSAVYVPADGPEVFMVMQGTVPNIQSARVQLTPQMMMAAMIKYSTESGVADELESAMVTAMSLYENRYLSRVSLPRVVSTIDLVLPAFVQNRGVRAARPQVSKEMAVTVGRLHQMSMLLVVKDILMAAKAGTSRGFSYAGVVGQYLTGQEEVISRLSSTTTPLTVLGMTPHMKWMYKLDEQAMRDIDQMSMFEALWLCDGGSMSVRNGGVSVFKKGVSDMMPNNPYHEILRQELQKTGVKFDFTKLPKGNFTVASRYIRHSEEDDLTVIKYIEIDVKMVYECDFKPNDDDDEGPLVMNLRKGRSELRKARKTRKTLSKESTPVERPTGRADDEETSTSTKGDWAAKTVRIAKSERSLFSSAIKSRSRAESGSNAGDKSDEEKANAARLENIRIAMLRRREEESKRVEEEKRKEAELIAKQKEEDDVRAKAMEAAERKAAEEESGLEKTRSMIREAVKESMEAKEADEGHVEPSGAEVYSMSKTKGGLEKELVEVPNDISALSQAGMTSRDTVGGMQARDMMQRLRKNYSVDEFDSKDLARLLQILKGVEVTVRVWMMTLPELKHIVTLRDSYNRNYRSTESGFNRQMCEADGKVVGIEYNLRKFRRGKDETISVPTGIVLQSDLRTLCREFWLAPHEVSPLVNGKWPMNQYN